MAYNISNFIIHAENGHPIQIVLNTFRKDWVGMIGGQKVWLGEQQEKVTLTNGVRTVSYMDNMVLDLGTKFSAKQVLDSYQLRKAILDGIVLATAGTVRLSLEPVEDNEHSSSSSCSCSSSSSCSCSCSSCSCSSSSCSCSSCSCSCSSSCSSSFSSSSSCSCSCSCSSCSCSSSSCSCSSCSCSCSSSCSSSFSSSSSCSSSSCSCSSSFSSSSSCSSSSCSCSSSFSSSSSCSCSSCSCSSSFSSSSSCSSSSSSWDMSLVARWKLDESSGTNAEDSFGGYDATLQGFVGDEWSTDRMVGTHSLPFSAASSQYARVLVSPPGVGSGNFSVSFWVKTTQVMAGFYTEIISKGDWASGCWTFQCNYTTSGIGFLVEGESAHAQSSVLINDGKWHHIVGVMGSSGSVLYIDSVSQATGTRGGVSITDGEIQFATAVFRPGRFLDGKLDDIRYFDAALTLTDVQALFAEGSSSSSSCSSSFSSCSSSSSSNSSSSSSSESL